MNALKKIALLMLLALWVPATSHCLLAALSGLESLTCCSHEQAASTLPYDDDCTTDGCSSVESGLYKNELTRITAPQPLVLHLLFDPLQENDRHASSLTARNLSDSLSEIVCSWCFRTRTALPARAPNPLV